MGCTSSKAIQPSTEQLNTVPPPRLPQITGPPPRVATTTGRTPQEPAPYVYQRLDDASSQIRRLRLNAELAILPSGETVPQGSLSVTHLSDRPTYTALSYSWGDPAATTVMLLDGKVKLLTRNLGAYLVQRARDMRQAGQQSLICWADSICINQDDNEEKSHQVRLMSKIFSGASTVEAWLGPATPSTLAGFDCIRDIHQICNDAPNKATAQIPLAETLQIETMTYLLRRAGDRIEPFVGLLQVSWWRRVWVQQEIFLASFNNIVLVCGTHRIEWRFVAQVFMAIQLLQELPRTFMRRNLSWEDYDWLVNWIPHILMHMTPYLSQHSQLENIGGELANDRTLISQLVTSIFLGPVSPRATLDVDYVYGRLGIASDTAAVTKYVYLDYSKSSRQVYTEAAYYLYSTNGPLALCLADVTAGKHLGLPSWVPDWSALLPRYPLSWDFRPEASARPNELFKASGRLHQFHCKFLGDRLQLHGFQVDSISGQGLDQSRSFQVPSTGGDPQEAWLCAFDDWTRNLFGENLERKRDIVWRIPIGDKDLELPERAKINMMHAFQEVVAFARRRRDNIDGPALSHDGERYRYANANVGSWRIPFVTSQGRVGLGPDTIEQGDLVFILAGVDTPYVFRQRQNGQLELRGEAYVEGLMDGKAVNSNTTLKTLEIV